MKISGVDIRPGNILEYEKGIWKVAKTQHTQPGEEIIFSGYEQHINPFAELEQEAINKEDEPNNTNTDHE